MKKIAYFFLGLVALLGLSICFQEIEIGTLGYYLENGEFTIKGGAGLALTGLVLPSSKANLQFRKKEIKELKFDKGIYQEASNSKLSVADFLLKAEIAAGFEMNSSDVCKIDPIDRQLLAMGLNPFSSATLVEDFFNTNSSNSKILFPAWIEKQIVSGMKLGRYDLVVDDLKAASKVIPGKSIDQIGLDFDKEDVDMAKVLEGTKFPTATIGTKEQPGKLTKVGRKFLFSYEAVRQVSIDMMSIFLQRVGFRMSRQMAQEALRVMIHGDGNPGSAAKEWSTESTTFKYKDLLSLIFEKFDEGHQISHVVLNKRTLMKILSDEVNFKPFQTLNLSEKLVSSGDIVPFFGCTWKVHPSLEDDTVLAYEKSSCLAYYEEKNSSILDQDKIIDQQFERTVVSLNFGFSKLFGEASHIMKLNTTIKGPK
ncbi:phage capsid protein [Leptospira alexanderi]|uniref:phage major capsid protein n=1 Tax=Leptospira alexanderi TaxID=100053 RepID=UPI000990EC4B|nr:phage capsid protein [Leptospira alexanderi]